MNRCGVYAITHTATGRMYIGKSTDMDRRWHEHQSDARSKSKYIIHRAIRKYGVDAFVFEPLELCSSEDDALAAEAYWIDWYDTCSPKGFNMTSGGRGPKFTDEVRKKISDAGKGRVISPEARAKISAFHRGRKKSDAERAKLSACKKGRTLTDAHKAKIGASGKGLTRSDETRRRISEARKGKKLSPEAIEKLKAAWVVRRLRAASGGEQCELDW